jgi:proline dehydrogenase
VAVLERPLRAAILAAAESPYVRRAVARYGFRLGAGRFVAGETPEAFLAVARELNERGFAVACGILGEGVRDAAQAADACSQYCTMLRTFAQQGLDANVAFKLTHVGLDLDPGLALTHAAQIAQTALDTHNTVRLDMEQSRYVDPTLSLYRRLRERFENVGFVLQSCLRRSLDDLRAALPLRPNVRLVKGAYLESPAVAFPAKREVDENYLRLAELALSGEGYTAFATHDPRLVQQLLGTIRAAGLPQRGRFEFQLLYGIGEPLARSLLRDGYRVRLAVPFGRYWFPYLMRRLAERPANLAFVLKGAIGR